eukprot:8135830-Pyramimonas_sp.AAC.1
MRNTALSKKGGSLEREPWFCRDGGSVGGEEHHRPEEKGRKPRAGALFSLGAAPIQKRAPSVERKE